MCLIVWLVGGARAGDPLCFHLSGAPHYMYACSWSLSKLQGSRAQQARACRRAIGHATCARACTPALYSHLVIRKWESVSAGHGSQKRDYSGDERDGMNETICPSDFESAGQIVDDDLNARLVRRVPSGCILHALLDACHSGTGMDLPFVAMIDPRRDQMFWTDERGQCAATRFVFDAHVCCIASRPSRDLTRGAAGCSGPIAMRAGAL
jgi:Caspase domain